MPLLRLCVWLLPAKIISRVYDLKAVSYFTILHLDE